MRLHAVRKVHGTGENAVTALDGITHDFPSGTLTAIMGPSGSGKSTLLHCAAGLDRPTSGRVELAGHDLTTLDEVRLTKLRRDRIGFVFQAFNLVESLTAAQNVELPARFARRRLPAAQVTAALDAVGLADRARHRPGQLSGGQQQRVALARALATRPAVLFADEPTGALDTTTGRHVLHLLRTLVDQHGRTTVMVTHDPAAAAVADTVLLLKDGRLTESLTLHPGRLAANTATIAGRMAQLEVA
ncbi:ABC transporter [Kitasatospora cheerisanensis KCTC 2395]|uniref:ABC transporter n=1 Tax=Kitasatospora cheerisanensis KCTC 2395 TaxID=1348663 RepID=A0A066YVV8_9ACTN|nr:ABC transporter [Kitasatospora cheerisanensis KCTC 2395]